MAVEVERVPCLSDNYAWVLHDTQTNLTAVVDPSERDPVVKALEAKGWKLDYILNTHHHWDHTGGNLELKKLYKCTIVGPKADEERIPGIDIALADGEKWKFGGHELTVYDTPGHTKGHITFWMPSADALFPGDTLFSLGCGRLFEGKPQQMWDSLSKLVKLPDNTRVFCAHEYTQANAKFAIAVDPDNQELQQRKKEIDSLRSKNEATIPSTLGQEKATNPFLRPHAPAIRKYTGCAPDAADWQVFAAVRALKDKF